MSLLAFSPSTSVTLAVTATQSNAIIGGTGHYLRFCNGGTGNAFIRFYEPTDTVPVVNPSTSMMLPSGAIEIFSVASDQTRVGMVGDSTGTSVNITRGEGQ